MNQCTNKHSNMERYLQCFTLAILTGLCLAQPNADENACDPSLHKIMNGTHRSTGYDTRTSETPLCDNKFRRGWYKFVDYKGDSVEMATSCPGINKCGATFPLWMRGALPTVEDEIVTRRLCGQLQKTANADCCEYDDEVFVRNCGGFYIYYLNPTLECPAVYCAGTATRCPAGQWSTTNYEPCKNPGLSLDTPPKVTGPNMKSDKTFDFKCEIELEESDPKQVFQVVWTVNGAPASSVRTETLTGSQRVATLGGDIAKRFIDSAIGCKVTTYYVGKEQQKNTYISNSVTFGVQNATVTGPTLTGNNGFKFVCDVTSCANDQYEYIEIIWTFDGKEDPKIKAKKLPGQQSSATLDGADLKGHINSNVGCQARLVYSKYSITTIFRKSITYFAGIQVNTNQISISDSEGEKQFIVSSTIPVICEQGSPCCLNFKMKIDKVSVVSIKDSCDHTICTSDWDADKNQASFTVTVVPSRNAISSGTRTAILSFEDIVLSGSGPIIEFFVGKKPNPLSISIKLEPGYSCSLTGDPHITQFDYKRRVVDLYKAGDYVAYYVKNRDFMVQIRTYKCFNVACICGVVIKEKNDIIRVHGCNIKKNLAASPLDIPYPLSAGTEVKRARNGANIGVLLSSGSYIKIDILSSAMNVYIQTPAYDKAQATGVCGTNDGIADNDFTSPNGTIFPICTGSSRCIPVAFTESWKVIGQNSMFEVTPEKVNEEPPTEFCSCAVNAQGKSQLACSPREHIEDPGLACPNCPVIDINLNPKPWNQENQEPFVPEEIAPVDPNKKWPNEQKITESQARDLCTKAIRKSQVFTKCQNLGTLADNAVDECLGDILFGGTTDTLDIITSTFTSKCQITLSQDEKNYNKGSDGKMTLKFDIIGPTCSDECLQHGECGDDGKCQCLTGWEGTTCQTSNGKTPQIEFSTGNPTCSAVGKLCESVQLEKINFNINIKVKCRVQKYDNQGQATGEVVIIDPISETGTKVTCPLSKSELSVQIYEISVTSDGQSYSNSLNFYTFDSTCMRCVETRCQILANYCFIESICYRNGVANTNNRNQVCDTKVNPLAWTGPSAAPCV